MRVFQECLWGCRELFFPATCSLCAQRLQGRIRYVCLDCRLALPVLDLHLLEENEVTDRFYGRLPLLRGLALCRYSPAAQIRRLLWQLKYDDRPEIGTGLGGWLGSLAAEGGLMPPDPGIVPVPLHPRRQRRRGYNQAERFGSGLAEAMGGEVMSRSVSRIRHTTTQTRKSAEERAANVRGVFHVSEPERLHGRHLILVDDVLTTGATLEALGEAILKSCKPASISAAVIATATL